MEEIKKDMEKIKKDIENFNNKYGVKLDLYYGSYLKEVKLTIRYGV